MLNCFCIHPACIHSPSFFRTARRAFEAALLHPDSLQPYVPLMQRSAVGFMRGLRAAVAEPGREVDMAAEYGRLTMEVVGRCAYG